MPAKRTIEGSNLWQDVNTGFLGKTVRGLELPITNPAIYATIAVGSESTNVRGITITLLNGEGKAINFAQQFNVTVYSNSNMTALATGGSTGLAAGGVGIIVATLVSKLHFLCKTNGSGVMTMTWTDTGTEGVYLGIKLPGNGYEYRSALIQNT